MAKRYWLSKIVRTALTLWIVVTFTFIVLRTSGDPVIALLSPDALPAEIEQFRHQWQLDQSLLEQYLAYLLNMFQGSFGKSYQDGRQVIDIISERLPNTLLLGCFSYFLAMLIGIPAGILAALKRSTTLDRMIMSLSVAGFALPNFFFGILLILLFSLSLRWLPSAGMGTFWHLIMPSITLGFAVAGTLARFTRSAMLEVLERPYMRTIAAKGAPFLYGVVFHALPNAAIPVITVLGLNLGAMVGGAVVVETVFGWPGIGRLLVTAVTARDLAVVQGLVLLMAAFMIMMNLLVDIAYGLIDPRIRTKK